MDQTLYLSKVSIRVISSHFDLFSQLASD